MTAHPVTARPMTARPMTARPPDGPPDDRPPDDRPPAGRAAVSPVTSAIRGLIAHSGPAGYAIRGLMAVVALGRGGESR